jgi:hypothetical protein
MQVLIYVVVLKIHVGEFFMEIISKISLSLHSFWFMSLNASFMYNKMTSIVF